MSIINALSQSTAPSPAQAQNRDDGALGQEQYLKLMITQFQNQDPFKPMENGEFLGQIAQFGTVSGLTELQESFNALAGSISSDQTLQASSMIGRTVLTTQDTAALPADGTLAGAVDVPAPTSLVTVEVRDAAGQVVRRLGLGAQSNGLARFEWDGQLEDGSAAPAGAYTFSARALGPDGPEAVPTLVSATVRSVSLTPDTGALSLNFDGMPSLSLREIREIM